MRVTASALAATSRTLPSISLPSDQPRTATAEPGLTSAARSSGTENTTSRAPSCAMRTTGVPAVTTWPGSASIAVMMPGTSATSVV